MAPNTCGILSDLKKFLSGQSVGGFQTLSKNRVEIDNVEIVKTATNLLKQLPASREAVLYYFCQVIDDSIKQHLTHLHINEVPANKKRRIDQSVIPMIQDSLSSLIVWNPKGWAPIISTWSLRLLGRMSSYHSPQLRMSRLDNGLNDTLQVPYFSKYAVFFQFNDKCYLCLDMVILSSYTNVNQPNHAVFGGFDHVRNGSVH